MDLRKLHRFHVLTIVAAIVGHDALLHPSLVCNRLFRPRPTAGASVPGGA